MQGWMDVLESYFRALEQGLLHVHKVLGVRVYGCNKFASRRSRRRFGQITKAAHRAACLAEDKLLLTLK